MNLRQEILKEHSKRQALKITAWVGTDTERFMQLLDLLLHDDALVQQRAAYALHTITDTNPQLILPYLEPLIENLKKPGLHDAVKRTTVRLLQDIEIPEDLLGTAADICFGYLASATEPVAVKAFSMTVLLNIARRYPDIKNELHLLVEEQLPIASSGLLNRAQKVLKELDKL